MRHASRLPTLACLALITASCNEMGPHEQQMTELGCIGGALTGGLVGLAAGRGNGTAVAVGAGAGLLAGCAAGNIIGRQLDERDRRAAEAATVAALNAPPPAPRRPVVHRWRSDHDANYGHVTVQSATRTAGGGECKQVTEVAYIQGKEVDQPMKYCRGGPEGEWQAA